MEDNVKKYKYELSKIFKEKYNYFIKFFYNKYKYKKINLEDIEDLISEAFLKAFINLKKYNPKKAKMSTWLLKIIENNIKDFLKRNYINFSVFENYIYQVSFNNLPHYSIIHKQLFNLLVKEIKILPKSERNIIILVILLGVSDKEVEKLLNISNSSVRTNKSRANKFLKTKLKKLNELFAIEEISIKELQLYEKEINSIINDEKIRKIFTMYFFKAIPIDNILTQLCIKYEEFVDAIYKGLDIIAASNIERYKKEAEETNLKNIELFLNKILFSN